MVACMSSKVTQQEIHNILVIMAHPDDETWISGTLAKLADGGLIIVPIYITSGDRGSDRSGQGLSGKDLAVVREKESLNASKKLGLSTPIYMRFPDGKIQSHALLISEQLEYLKEEYKPELIFTFDPLGITGNKDHQAVSEIVSNTFKKNRIYFTISKSRADNFILFAKQHDLVFKIKEPVKNAEVSHKIDVTDYSKNRIAAIKQYKTQFPPLLVSVFSGFTKKEAIEELIIIDNATKKKFERYIND